MLTTPSQCRDLVESRCPAAWHGGLRSRPTFQRHPGTLCLDTASVHALLRAAGLPEAELAHMGGRAVLACTGPWLAQEHVLPLLGRIEFDRECAAGGTGWGGRWLGGDAMQLTRSHTLGAQVVRRWFR